MSVTKKAYNINSNHQLIDLNGDATNFYLMFNIVPNCGDEYEIIIVNQEQLDQGTLPAYKKVKGSQGGEMKLENDQYQNWFLSIKSATPMTVEVETKITKLPYPLNKPATDDKPKRKWFIYLIPVGIVVAVAVGIFFYMKRKKVKSSDKQSPFKSRSLKEKEGSKESFKESAKESMNTRESGRESMRGSFKPSIESKSPTPVADSPPARFTGDRFNFSRPKQDREVKFTAPSPSHKSARSKFFDRLKSQRTKDI